MANVTLAPSQSITKQPEPVAALMERVLIGGDLSKLSTAERLQYYSAVCSSVGLNPLTKPFEYITLNGKLTLYARKDATDQLRQMHSVSITDLSRELIDGILVVTASAENAQGRKDQSIGAVAIEHLKGEAKANAIMKAETKAKRRVTLSICGLGMLDETEIETIPNAQPVTIQPEPSSVIQLEEPQTIESPEWDDIGSTEPAISKASLIKISHLCTKLEEGGVAEEEWRTQLHRITGKRSRKDLSESEVGEVLKLFAGMLNEIMGEKKKGRAK